MEWSPSIPSSCHLALNVTSPKQGTTRLGPRCIALVALDLEQIACFVSFLPSRCIIFATDLHLDPVCRCVVEKGLMAGQLKSNVLQLT
jgi:hypothetical protein